MAIETERPIGFGRLKRKEDARFIRETLDLTGTHWSCDTSSCGACVVLMDGKPLKSCTALAVMCDGHGHASWCSAAQRVAATMFL